MKFKINEFEGPLDLLLHLIKENEMEKMPKEDLETQLSLLYEIEEKIRNKQEYDISKQNDYFSKITKELEKYNNKIRMR